MPQFRTCGVRVGRTIDTVTAGRGFWRELHFACVHDPATHDLHAGSGVARSTFSDRPPPCVRHALRRGVVLRHARQRTAYIDVAEAERTVLGVVRAADRADCSAVPTPGRPRLRAQLGRLARNQEGYQPTTRPPHTLAYTVILEVQGYYYAA